MLRRMNRRVLASVVGVIASLAVVSPATSVGAAGVPGPATREVDSLDRRLEDVSADGRYALTSDFFWAGADTRVNLLTGAKDVLAFRAFQPHLTDDGTAMVYSTGVDDTFFTYTFANQANQQIALVNAPANWGFALIDISGDGRYLALQGSSGVYADSGVFVYDTVSHVWRQPDSLMPDFAIGPQRQSGDASISSSGRYTAWTTYPAGGARSEVWVYDWTTDTAVNAGPRVDGAPYNDGDGAWDPDISSDGRSVVFRSDSSNLVSFFPTVVPRVYVRRLDAGETVMVTENESQGTSLEYKGPSIGGPGSVVGVLEDRSTRAPDPAVNPLPQPVLYYLPALSSVGLGQPTGSTLANGYARSVLVSENASRAVFATDADNFMSVTPTDPAGTLSTRVFAADIASALPTRLMDTRPGFATDDGQFQGGGPLAASSVTQLVVGGRRGIPLDATAVGLNVTVTGSTAAGHVTIFPCGQTQPLASSLNIPAGGAVANLVISQLGTSAAVCISPSVAVHVIVDAVTVFPAGSQFAPLVPQRMLDTRPIGATIDGQFKNLGPLVANTDLQLQLTGRTNIASGAVAVALNIAAIAPGAAGFVTAYPCGTTPPEASVLNFRPSVTRASLTIVPLSPSGAVCLRSNTSVHLLADAVGFFGPGSTYTALNPARLADTRPLHTTIDHLFEATGTQAAGSTMQLTIAGRGGAPAGNSTVSLGVVAAGNTGGGYLTVYPCGLPQPASSTLNFIAGAASNNHVIVDTGSSGQVCVFASGPTHVIVDIEGVLP
jgi:hypothetical protein